MNFKLELPEDTILINRKELRELLQEIFFEIYGEQTIEEIMTIREAANYLKVSVPTIRNMIASKEIPFFQRGQVIRLSRWEVKEWLRDNSSINNRS